MATSLRIQPAANRTTLSTPKEQQLVKEAVLRLASCLPITAELEVEIFDPIIEGTSLQAAHARWTELRFQEVETPVGLPRKPLTERCRKGLIKADANCINERTPSMGSWYGFKGYSLSILISLDDGTVWDARGEPAK